MTASATNQLSHYSTTTTRRAYHDILQQSSAYAVSEMTNIYYSAIYITTAARSIRTLSHSLRRYALTRRRTRSSSRSSGVISIERVSLRGALYSFRRHSGGYQAAWTAWSRDPDVRIGVPFRRARDGRRSLERLLDGLGVGAELSDLGRDGQTPRERHAVPAALLRAAAHRRIAGDECAPGVARMARAWNARMLAWSSPSGFLRTSSR